MNKYPYHKLYLLILISCCCCAPIRAQTIAATPPMGWNSYDCFGYSVREEEVKANADYMAQYLKQYGWQYIVVDYLWSFDKPAGNTRIPFQVKSGESLFAPWLAMDKWGRLIPDTGKFPLSADGKGFKPLADYVHTKGLKFGIHVMRGIPRQAVWAKSPVNGIAGVTADMVADTSSTCKWLNHMYGLDMKKTGAQEYLNSLLELYASWGVDYIKVDDLSYPYSEPEIEGYKKAIDQCERDILLSLSPGPTPLNEADHAAKYANMWRITDDFWDNTWKQVLNMFDYTQKWKGKGTPGHWPDCDMLMIGKISSRGPDATERYSRFTEDELYTMMTLWCIFRSPLIIGGNLLGNRSLELKLFTNNEVLAVNQQGRDPRQLYRRDSTVAWYSHIRGSTDIYVALFNTSDTVQNVSVDFQALGLNNYVVVRNLWDRQNIGQFKKKYQQNIRGHGTALFRFSPIK